MNKPYEVHVADGGGLAVVLSIIVGSYLSLIFAKVFWNFSLLGEVDAVFLSFLLLSVVGFLEDLTNLFRNKGGKKIGFKQKYKFLLPLPAALPILLAVMDRTYIFVPFLGNINLGLVYALILVPVGIIGASNATNLLGGLNGLEAGLASVMFLGTAIYSYLNAANITFFLSLSVLGGVLGFLVYNKYPSKIFPGDSFTYFVGGALAVISIIGDFEWFGVLLIAPWFIELALKWRSNFKAESFGKVNRKGLLVRPYSKIYSLTHVFMNEKRENEIVVRMVLLYAVYVAVILAIFLY
ncbi:MAG: hypothetical protein GXN99_01520 [Candidatus Nanohaloarchaeota archaeon]|nr:hypothetical protein [Candidatus Nanohaloarchaeota archaeon]